MTFQEYKDIIRIGIESGKIQFSKPISELDLATDFAVQRLMCRNGLSREEPFTVSDICNEILTFCGKEVFDNESGWFYETEDKQ